MKNSVLTLAIFATFNLNFDYLRASNSIHDKSIDQHSCKNGFLPKNDHYIPEYTKFNMGGITQDEFNSVLDNIEKIFSPIIRNYGGSLKIERLWSDGTVNASANRQGNTYNIKMYGGLARHQTITKDAFALVACHEIGHHIGGVPKYSSQGGTWASVEGQSDYFATSKCLRKLFSGEDNDSIIKTINIDPLVKIKCEDQFTNLNEVALCKRISMAGLSSASLFADMNNRNLPRFETPDSAVVSATDESHPDYQCRLDTYFQGAICEIDMNTEIGQSDPNVGTCNRRDNFTQGLRPLCWYRPTHGAGTPDPVPDPTPDPDPPMGEIATQPTSNGQTAVVLSDPMASVPIMFDVSRFSNAAGMAIELSKPNREFTNPNGTEPDRQNGLGTKVFRRTRGIYNFIPQRELPGFGSYQIRVIGLDQNQKPISRFSDSFRLFISN